MNDQELHDYFRRNTEILKEKESVFREFSDYANLLNDVRKYISELQVRRDNSNNDLELQGILREIEEYQRQERDYIDVLNEFASQMREISLIEKNANDVYSVQNEIENISKRLDQIENQSKKFGSINEIGTNRIETLNAEGRKKYIHENLLEEWNSLTKKKSLLKDTERKLLRDFVNNSSNNDLKRSVADHYYSDDVLKPISLEDNSQETFEDVNTISEQSYEDMSVLEKVAYLQSKLREIENTSKPKGVNNRKDHVTVYGQSVDIPVRLKNDYIGLYKQLRDLVVENNLTNIPGYEEMKKKYDKSHELNIDPISDGELNSPEEISSKQNNDTYEFFRRMRDKLRLEDIFNVGGTADTKEEPSLNYENLNAPKLGEIIARSNIASVTPNNETNSNQNNISSEKELGEINSKNPDRVDLYEGLIKNNPAINNSEIGEKISDGLGMLNPHLEYVNGMTPFNDTKEQEEPSLNYRSSTDSKLDEIIARSNIASVTPNNETSSNNNNPNDISLEESKKGTTMFGDVEPRINPVKMARNNIAETDPNFELWRNAIQKEVGEPAQGENYDNVQSSSISPELEKKENDKSKDSSEFDLYGSLAKHNPEIEGKISGGLGVLNPYLKYVNGNSNFSDERVNENLNEKDVKIVDGEPVVEFVGNYPQDGNIYDVDDYQDLSEYYNKNDDKKENNDQKQNEDEEVVYYDPKQDSESDSKIEDNDQPVNEQVNEQPQNQDEPEKEGIGRKIAKILKIKKPKNIKKLIRNLVAATLVIVAAVTNWISGYFYGKRDLELKDFTPNDKPSPSDTPDQIMPDDEEILKEIISKSIDRNPVPQPPVDEQKSLNSDKVPSEFNIGDEVTVKKDSPIFDNMYDATDYKNQMGSYFDSNDVRGVKSVAIMLNGQLINCESPEEVELYKSLGGEVLAYGISHDKNNYEGFYNSNDVVYHFSDDELNQGGMHR